MRKLSAGLLIYRRRGVGLEVFLVHPGGPFWARKDLGAWSVPKGEHAESEDALAAAIREFGEETGFHVDGPFVSLGEIRQPSGKLVRAWAVQADLDPVRLVSNPFTMEWPRGSGKMREFPEVDRGAWFGMEDARRAILKGQVGFLDRLETAVGVKGGAR